MRLTTTKSTGVVWHSEPDGRRNTKIIGCVRPFVPLFLGGHTRRRAYVVYTNLLKNILKGAYFETLTWTVPLAQGGRYMAQRKGCTFFQQAGNGFKYLAHFSSLSWASRWVSAPHSTTSSTKELRLEGTKVPMAVWVYLRGDPKHLAGDNFSHCEVSTHFRKLS